MLEREHWIDMLRGLCMLSILLDHTEIYYTGGNLIPYDWYVSNVLIVFFFLSGYLMYKQQGFSLRRKMVSIGRSLLLSLFSLYYSFGTSESLCPWVEYRLGKRIIAYLDWSSLLVYCCLDSF